MKKKFFILFTCILFFLNSCNTKSTVNNIPYNTNVDLIEHKEEGGLNIPQSPKIEDVKRYDSNEDLKDEFSSIEKSEITIDEENKLIEKLEEENNRFSIVKKYAPVFFQETYKKSQPEYWDFITSIDFDGDLIGNNNEQSLKKNNNKLPATVYYSLVETKTHFFIIYSLFHPLDWASHTDLIPYTWHENDMENVQVVIRKATEDKEEKVVILSTQAHLDTDIFGDDSAVKSGAKQITGNKFLLLTENLTTVNGTHPALYVETGGHGIHNIYSKRSKFKTFNKPELNEGFTFIPSENKIDEFYEDKKNTYNYQLKSTYDNFWVHYLNKQNMGDGRLLDGYFDYKDELFNLKKIPRHFDSDRSSGPGKKDAGILPFAFSYSLVDDDLGVLFFNPAKKYIATLTIEDEWSKEYIFNPYLENS